MKYVMAGSLILSLLMLTGCALVEEWEPVADSSPSTDAEDCPEPDRCPTCDCPECPSCETRSAGTLLDPSFKEQYLVELINEYRQEEGLETLKWSGELYIAAVFHAQAWAQACRSQESCSDQCWRNDQCPYELSLAERLQLAGYRGAAEEILAAGDGYYDSRDVIRDWTDQEWYPPYYSALTNSTHQQVACSFVRCHYCWVHTIYVCLLGKQ